MTPKQIVILGRPNVGKSTLFNRLLGRKRALVHDEPGVTRDRLIENIDWWFNKKPFPFSLIDTGGLGGERFSEEIRKQVRLALQKADLVLFVFDSQTGLTPLDEELLRELKRSDLAPTTPVFAVVNKVDDEVHEERIADFFSVGLDPVLTLSAEHGRGIDDLKNEIASALGLFELSEDEKVQTEEDPIEEENEEEVFEKRPPQIAIVGRPNVGKSTLINAILGEDRMITSPVAGTTVDSIDSQITLNGKPYLFVDTAGIRRKGKTEQGIEVLSVVQTRKALERADIAILVLDGEIGISDQDEKITGIIEEVGCSVVLLMNKWDTQRNNPKFTQDLAAERIRAKMGHMKYAPILFASALRKQGLNDLGELLEEIMHQRSLKIPTHEFSEWVRKESTIHNPKNAKFYLCHQSGRNPPTFVCHVNDPEKIHFSLKRHLLNGIRERWGYMGTPIRLHFVAGKSTRSLPKSLAGRKPAQKKKKTLPRKKNVR